MDLNDLQHLTDAQKERYMLLQRGFESQFWGLLVAWANQNANEQLGRLFHAANWDANRVAFGAHGAFQMLANLEQSVEVEFANYAAEAQEAREAVAEVGNES